MPVSNAMLVLLAISFVLILIAGAWWYGAAFVEAYLEVKNKPREKMGWCHKHGLIREKHMLPLGFMDVCPICYKKTLDQAGQMK